MAGEPQHMPEKIYAVDEFAGKVVLVSAVVLKETPKQIVTGRTGLAFHCRKLHDPSAVYRTPAMAIAAWRERLAERIEQARKHLARLEELATKDVAP